MAVPESEWRWRGMPGHFVAASQCCFHMVTEIGEHRVSTIGCYHKPADARAYETRAEIGSGRLYETMVFRLTDGEITDWSEIDSDGYNKEADAEAGHMAMCRKWADD